MLLPLHLQTEDGTWDSSIHPSCVYSGMRSGEGGDESEVGGMGCQSGREGGTID